MSIITLRIALALGAIMVATSCGGSGDEAENSLSITGVSGDPVEFSTNSRLLIRCTEPGSAFDEDGLGVAYSSPRFLEWLDTVLAGDFIDPSQALIDDPDSFLIVQIPLAAIELDRTIDIDATLGSVFVLDANDDSELISDVTGQGVTIEFAKAPCIGDDDELEMTISGELADERNGAPASIEATLTGVLET